MSTKQIYTNVLNKAYRNNDLTMEDIKTIAENPVDTVSKVEILLHEGKLQYRILYENSMSKNIGNIL